MHSGDMQMHIVGVRTIRREQFVADNSSENMILMLLEVFKLSMTGILRLLLLLSSTATATTTTTTAAVTTTTTFHLLIYFIYTCSKSSAQAT